MQSTWHRITCYEQLTHDRAIFLARWNGRICIAQYKEEEDCIYASFNPADLGEFKITRDKFDKFDYFLYTCYLEEINIDEHLYRY